MFSEKLINAREAFRATFNLEGPEADEDYIVAFELDMHDALHGIIGANPSQEDEILVEYVETVLRGDKTPDQIKGEYSGYVSICISEMDADIYAELELCYHYYQTLVWLT